MDSTSAAVPPAVEHGSTTVARARDLGPDLLHESVDDEWSFIQTLRHLVFATDAWINRAILGDPHPWDPLDLPFDTVPVTEPAHPEPISFPVRDCLLCILDEEWAHRDFAERDLAVLTSREQPPAG